LKITKDDITRFARVCEMLGSSNEQERATAALKATQQLRKWDLTWTDLLTNPIHLLLTNPTQLQNAVKKVWEETQAREHEERIERRWAELQRRAEALRSSHGMLLLQKERDLLDKVTRRSCTLQWAEEILPEVEKEIVVTVHRVKTDAAQGSTDECLNGAA
jgi:hypothetical protein